MLERLKNETYVLIKRKALLFVQGFSFSIPLNECNDA